MPGQERHLATEAGAFVTEAASEQVLPTLFDDERDDLSALEAVIERGLATFVEVGKALARIRDARLYRETHTTFEAYCAERWDLRRQTAYDYIHAAEVAENVRTCVQTELTLSQARTLAPLPPAEQIDLARRINFGGTTTAALRRHVRGARKDIQRQQTARPERPAPSVPAVLADTVVLNNAVIRRATAPPSKWTFTIEPIKELIDRYVGDGRGWIDPFAGLHSPAEYTNDLDPRMPTTHHLEAAAFCTLIEGPFKGVLVDPPYSYRQVSDCYKECGLKASSKDTTSHFYNRVMNAVCDKVQLGGLAISCGWNSNGFGKNRGFEVVEVLIVAHGQHRNDTIVTVERKVVMTATGHREHLQGDFE